MDNSWIRRLHFSFSSRRKRHFIKVSLLFSLCALTVYNLQPRKPNLRPDFRLLLPDIEPILSAKERRMHVAVVVNSRGSGPEHRELRRTIRKTWGNWKHFWKHPGNDKFKWRLFFSLGIADDRTDRNANLEEAREYNDVLIGNFTDNYINVVIKTFMGHYWAVTRISCKYVLKTDDDVYVRVPSLIRWLNDSGNPLSFYGGLISPHNDVNRDYTSPWYTSKEEYNGTTWPPWCRGAYHVLSTDIIPKYLNYTRIRYPFHTDDVYIGLASKDLGINVFHIPGLIFYYNRPKRIKPKMELMQAIALGHKLDAKYMMKLYTFYRKHKLQ